VIPDEMRYLLLVSILIYSCSVQAQYRSDRPVMGIVAGAGFPVVLGDIGTFGTGPVFTAGFRYRFDHNFSVKANIHCGLATGSDANSRNESRGLSYNTFFVESTVQAEYFFFQEKRGFDRRGRLISLPRIRPYVFGGTGTVYFKPTLDGEDLTSAETDFSKVVWTLLGGAGLSWSFNKKWIIAGEIGGRLLMIDYFDGFSPSASRANDLYYISTIHAIYRWETSRYRRRH
jgi:hypothetical protein